MIYNDREYRQVRNVVMGVSLIAWAIIFNKPASSSSWCCGGDCPSQLQMALGADAPLTLIAEVALTENAPGPLLGDWALMLLAMMTPTLIHPLVHVRMSSFASRRLRATVLFAAGYLGMWMLAGLPFLATMLASGAIWPGSYMPAIVVGMFALLWQASPIKQRALNRCHKHIPLHAFGKKADVDALVFGVVHGSWCLSSCWALMLFAMLLPEGHSLGMAAVSILVFCERLDPPKTPAWQWRGFSTISGYLMNRIPKSHAGSTTGA